MLKKGKLDMELKLELLIESNLSSKALILRLSHGCLWPGLAVYVRVVARRSKTWVLRKEEIVQDVVENPNYPP